jgi:uncharacterized protein
MIYIDTPVWVVSIVEEPKSDDVRSWLQQTDPEEIAVSDWVVTEFSSALSVKMRTGQIDAEQRAAALGAFTSTVTESLYLLPIMAGHFRAAASYADNHFSGLRAGDALHLAVAGGYGASLCTLDKTLAAAGSLLGIEAKLI